jgi:hypothetical protein
MTFRGSVSFRRDTSAILELWLAQNPMEWT